MTQATLWIASLETGGHVFSAVDVLPTLARARLAKYLAGFKGVDSEDVDSLVGHCKFREVRAGMAWRDDAAHVTGPGGVQC